MRWIVSVWLRWRGQHCCESCGRWFAWPVVYWHEGEPLCDVECWASSQPVGHFRPLSSSESELERRRR